MKTIRNVTIVVPVLMMSCQVSEKPKIGPVTAQAMMTTTASTNAHGEPTALDVACAKRRKSSFAFERDWGLPLPWAAPLWRRPLSSSLGFESLGAEDGFMAVLAWTAPQLSCQEDV